MLLVITVHSFIISSIGISFKNISEKKSRGRWKFDTKQIKENWGRWRADGHWDGKRNSRIKQIKFLFIAHCCPFTSIYPSRYSNGEDEKNYIECWEKIHTPCHSHNREREESTRACDASIFYFSSHSGDGFSSFFRYAAVCFLYPSIQGFYFISFFSFCCRDINWRKSYLWKCLLSYFFLANFLHFSLECKITVFFFEEGWRWCCCQIAIKSKHLFQRAPTWKMDSR